jgi:hypothetical protein
VRITRERRDDNQLAIGIVHASQIAGHASPRPCGTVARR